MLGTIVALLSIIGAVSLYVAFSPTERQRQGTEPNSLGETNLPNERKFREKRSMHLGIVFVTKILLVMILVFLFKVRNEVELIPFAESYLVALLVGCGVVFAIKKIKNY